MVVRRVLLESTNEDASEKKLADGQSGIALSGGGARRARAAQALLVHDGRHGAIAAALEERFGAVVAARGIGPAVEQALLEDVSLVVIDVESPPLEGLAIAARLRSFESTRRAPIVLFASADVDREVAARSCAGGPWTVVRRAADGEGIEDALAAIDDIVGELGAPIHGGRASSVELKAARRSDDHAARVAADTAVAHVLDVAGLGLWQLDAASGEISCDVRAATLLGLPAEHRAFADFLLAVCEEDRVRAKAAFVTEPDAEHGRVLVDLTTSGLAGPRRHVSLRLEFSGKAPARRYFGVVADVTPERVEDALRGVQLLRANEAWAAAELACRARDERLKKVSHELRDPLHAILGWSSHLLRGDVRVDDRTLETGLRVIERQARAQARIVEDILDFAGIASGKLSYRRGEVDIRAAVVNALEASTVEAKTKGLTLIARVQRGIGVIAGDPDRLAQVVSNLLANAVRFTRRGGRVEVAARRQSGGISIVVRDDGAGIERTHLPFVFDAYWQAETGSHRGLGLGLAIVRHLVELHGGTVRPSSDGPGTGAAFEVWLPSHGEGAGAGGNEGGMEEIVANAAREATSAPPSPTPSSLGPVTLSSMPASAPMPPSTPLPASSKEPRSLAEPASVPTRLGGRRILVVDDERDVRELVSRILQRSGATVDKAATMEEAMALLTTSTPDLVLTDITLGATSGSALLKWIREHERASVRDLPVVAMTAHTFDDHPDALTSEGFARHLVKPVHPRRLVDEVATLTEHEQTLDT